MKKIFVLLDWDDRVHSAHYRREDAELEARHETTDFDDADRWESYFSIWETNLE